MEFIYMLNALSSSIFIPVVVFTSCVFVINFVAYVALLVKLTMYI
jgi:hypothetical protein